MPPRLHCAMEIATAHNRGGSHGRRVMGVWLVEATMATNAMAAAWRIRTSRTRGSIGWTTAVDGDSPTSDSCILEASALIMVGLVLQVASNQVERLFDNPALTSEA